MRICDLRRRIRGFGLYAALIVLIVLASDQLWAQATAARSREAELTGFVMYSRVTPDYGPQGNNGVSVGAAYTKYLKWLSVGVEARFKDAPGTTVGERTFGGGVRVEHQWKYFHPYADFLISSGTISFANKDDIGSNGTGSNGSVVYSYGGGLDYDFAEQWAVRADYQGESWNLNETPNITLAPRIFSIGVLYRVRFRRDKDQ